MISVEEAEKLISDNLDSLPTETLLLEQSLGRTLREPLLADRELPPFNRATLDGIAIDSSAFSLGKHSFPIVGIAAAGTAPKTLHDSNTCFEIMTGAPLPGGTDAVIRVEDISIQDGTATVSTTTEVKPGLGVHPAGSDCRQGQILLKPGRTITAKETAIAASIGKTKVVVSKLPTINIVSTGNELVEISDTPLPHQIRRSNDSTLAAALISSGFSNTSKHHLPDDKAIVENSVATLLQNSDVLVIAGGISKGKYDYLPNALKENGAEMVFQWVSQRPGKPLWFGIYERGGKRIPIFALPGNPVSSFTCLHRYVIPALAKMAQTHEAPQTHIKLKQSYSFKALLSLFLPVSVATDNDGTLWATPLPFNTSGDFISVAQTSGFIQLPKDQVDFEVGSVHRYFPWS
ncbi:molybdopterin molybdotransferase MoeA [Puniceicoccaceae bacterium K14]|nr:molybdopterin molybdotransferase MoeA [Puniceicoccaceae bacterium K14]